MYTTPTLCVIPEVQQTSIPQVQSDPQIDRVGSLLENIQKRIDEMVTLLYSTNNHVGGESARSYSTKFGRQTLAIRAKKGESIQ